MIEQRYNITLGNGQAPYQYSLSADDPCVSFLRPTGTTDSQGNFVAILQFTDEACISSVSVTVSGLDANQCSFSLPLVLNDPCASLTINPIGATSDYEFSVTAADTTSANLQFTWVYDTALFDQLRSISSSFNSTLRLKPKAGVVLPASTIIKVTAKNSKGCSKTAQLTYTFCKLAVVPFTANLYCNSSGNYTSSAIVIPEPLGCLTAPDWTKLVIDAPTGITANPVGSTVQFTGSALIPGTYAGSYTVSGLDGIPATSALITFVVHECAYVKTISIPDKTWYLDCAASPGDVVELNIEDEYALTPGTVIDWSSWRLVEPPESTSPLIELATNTSGDHIIRYTVPSPFTADAFGWTIADTNGNYSNAVAYTISACPEIPVAVDDSFTVVCGDTTILNPLSNDLFTSSPIAPDTVQIVSGPTYGEVSVNANGTLTYDVANGIAGTDTFTYTVQNVHGNVSNTATITVTIICAGVDANVTICE